MSELLRGQKITVFLFRDIICPLFPPKTKDWPFSTLSASLFRQRHELEDVALVGDAANRVTGMPPPYCRTIKMLTFEISSPPIFFPSLSLEV
jgi:hypothetical protein